MNKVGIYSLHGYGNYGNKLQNYAVEQLVAANGFDPVSIILRAHPLRGLIRDAATIVKGLSGESREKTKRFLEFDSKCLHNVRPYTQRELLRIGHSDEFSAFIAGSDQVWYCENVDLTADKTNFYSNRFLQFAPEDKRVALAPSFGMDELPAQWNDYYADALSSINFLSVREKSGAQLVERLTGLQPPVIADPTLGFDSSFWGDLASSGNVIGLENPYIFSFFLGDISLAAKTALLAESRYAGLDIVGCRGDNKPISSAGPKEFLDLIRDAECVFTDSFHCVVFALIFHKEFYVSKRVGSPTMFGRIVTLLDGMNLNDRVLDDCCGSSASPIDWGLVDSVVEKRRNKLCEYVATSLRECQ